MTELPPPTPAATLVLMRPALVGPPELLMMERAGHMAFAAGALVFPGGRIDPEDHEAARLLADGSLLAAARVAAIRETIEETGIAPALHPGLDGDATQRLRERILAGEPLPGLLDAMGLRPNLDALVPFARWCPNFKETRRFDALFFLAEAPAGAPEPVVQEREGVRAFWASAETVIGWADEGRAETLFPTRRNLERLARFGSFAEAAADAAAREVRTITPWIEHRDHRPWVCIPEDAGYPVTAEPLERTRRT